MCGIFRYDFHANLLPSHGQLKNIENRLTFGDVLSKFQPMVSFAETKVLNFNLRPKSGTKP